MGDDVKVHGQELSAGELRRRTGSTDSLGGVRQVVLDDGVGRGIRVLEFRTATGLAFDVMVDRAMDLGAATHRGRSFGWRSGTGFRHPGLHEYADEGGVSWLRSFDGLMVSAGLDHTLFTAEVDASQYQYPHRSTVWNGLHGRVSNIPASLIGAGETWDGDRCVLWAEGEIRQAAVFGERLTLRRRIEADLDGDEIRLTDVVTNVGFDRTPHMFLYHINFGWPLVDAGTRFVAPVRSTVWKTDSADEQGVSYDVVPEPQPGFIEAVYEHQLVPDADGKARAALIRPEGEFGVEVSWDASAFPRFFEWMHLREGAYAVGLEPSTHAVGGAHAARDDGSMTWLEHGETRTYRTTIRVLDHSD